MPGEAGQYDDGECLNEENYEKEEGVVVAVAAEEP